MKISFCKQLFFFIYSYREKPAPSTKARLGRLVTSRSDATANNTARRIEKTCLLDLCFAVSCPLFVTPLIEQFGYRPLKAVYLSPQGAVPGNLPPTP
jgi:hypothetical protein